MLRPNTCPIFSKPFDRQSKTRHRKTKGCIESTQSDRVLPRSLTSLVDQRVKIEVGTSSSDQKQASKCCHGHWNPQWQADGERGSVQRASGTPHGQHNKRLKGAILCSLLVVSRAGITRQLDRSFVQKNNRRALSGQAETMTMTLKLSLEAWPYKRECRGHNPRNKESVRADVTCAVGKGYTCTQFNDSGQYVESR